MSVDSDIINGIFEILENAPGLSVAFPNVTYSGEKPYVRPSILYAPVGAQGVAVDDFVEHMGILQIDIVFVKGTGSLNGEDLINIINPLFKRGTRIRKNNTIVRFDKKGSRGNPIQDESEYFIPLNFPYKVLTNEV